MAKRYKVPNGVVSHVKSAESSLLDANSLPGAFRHNAARYLLYIRAWELYFIANAKFSAWANNEELDPKTLKDHGYKLEKSPTVQYIEVIDRKAVITEYKSKDQKSTLVKLLTYGRDDKSRDEIFFRGWFFDEFHNALIGNINLLKAAIQTVESLSHD